MRMPVKTSGLLAAIVATALAISPTVALGQVAGTTTSKTTAPPSAEKVKQAKEFSEAVTAVAEKVSPSVVQIDVFVKDDQGDGPWWLKGKKGDSPVVRGNGSGVIISSDGFVLTNNHVIEDAVQISVRTRDGRILPAKLRGRDPSTDLAVLKVEASGLTAAKLGDSDAAKVGEWVVAVGSPFGLSYSVTSGVLSAKGRGGLGMNQIEDYLQTDASINPGNSGGPLVNLNAEVLGINTMIVGRGTGIGFAVPANMAKRVAEQLIKNGKVVRAWLGVNLQELSPDLAKAFNTQPFAGVLVSDVLANGPAAGAKVVAGDIIARVAGKTVREPQDVIREVINHDVGSAISLEVIRGGKSYETKAILSARPEQAVKPIPLEEIKASASSGFGITMKPIPPEAAAKYGYGKALTYVSFVEPNSPADKAGLMPGDVILDANGTANPTIDNVKTAGAKGTLLLRIGRKDSRFYVAVTK